MAEPPHQGFHLLAIAGLSGELQQPFAKSRVQCPPLGAGHLPGLLNEIVIGTESNILHTESVYTRIVYLKLADASKTYVLKKSFTACHITWPPTSAMDLVSGMSFGQTSTQFCA